MSCSKNNKKQKPQKYNCLTNSLTRYCNNNNDKPPKPTECPTISGSYYFNPSTFTAGPNIKLDQELSLELNPYSGFLLNYFYLNASTYYALYTFGMTMSATSVLKIVYTLIKHQQPVIFNVTLTCMDKIIIKFENTCPDNSCTYDVPSNTAELYQIVQNTGYHNNIKIEYNIDFKNTDTLKIDFKQSDGENVYTFIMVPSFTLNTVYKFQGSIKQLTQEIVTLSYQLSPSSGIIQLPDGIINNDYYSILNNKFIIKNVISNYKIYGTFYFEITNYTTLNNAYINIYKRQNEYDVKITQKKITSQYTTLPFGYTDTFNFMNNDIIYLYWEITSDNTEYDINVIIGKNEDMTKDSSFDFKIIPTTCTV